MPKKMFKSYNYLLGFLLVLGVEASLLTYFSAKILPSAHAADITPPVTTYTLDPTTPNGENGWYVTPVKITLTSTDLESGVKQIFYKLNTGAWQSVSFSSPENLAPNPSFEQEGGGFGASSWEITANDPEVIHSVDPTTSYSGFESKSAKIVATGGAWHGVSHSNNPASANAFGNMTASAWLKTESVLGSAKLRAYALVNDGSGGTTSVLLGESPAVSGTKTWTYVSLNFIVSEPSVSGVYLDVGLVGPGTMWIDAVNLSTAIQPAQTTVTVGSEGNHTFQFYSVDGANNIETYTCNNPKKNCITFKSDLTAPTDWYDSGATRGLIGQPYELWVYTNVRDYVSGLSVFTDKFQIHTETDPGYGVHSDSLSCNSTWHQNSWKLLITPPFSPGAESAYLIIPKTSFCNSNWNSCKIARFYIKDMAGNEATKEFCINGPWIKFAGGNPIKSNHNIDMLSESPNSNTDGLIESAGNVIDFFTSSKNWKVRNTPVATHNSYANYHQMTGTKSQITNGLINNNSGIFEISGNYTLTAAKMNANYKTSTFNKVIFVNGNLTIDSDIDIHNNSTLLFIVKQNVNINKSINTVDLAILSDGSFNTAYNLAEGDATPTLNLRGIYSAGTFVFRRTLQGTNNNSTPSESFTYEPKYLIQLKDYFKSTTVKWVSED